MGARGVLAPGRGHAMHDHDRIGHQRDRSLYAARGLAGAGDGDAGGIGAGPVPGDHGIGQPLRDAARLRQPEAGRGAARSRRADAAAMARREGHARRRGGEVQGWRARLEAERDPAALYRKPRTANPQARGRRRRRRADRQLRHAARDQLRQAAYPAGPAGIQPRLARISGSAPGSISPCSSVRTIRCRTASSAE